MRACEAPSILRSVVPICYQCHRKARWVSPQDWSAVSGQPIDRSDGFPLHLALFWVCDRCDLSGARLHLP